ncbi:MAG: hypothetical protein OZSIB_2272 [Candidatus Ozemobacter sibiricus]|jgi:HEAT repeat protein|uniref:HEAT repeat domain-containing protein n=1 Tax=Candidatus Ozemobacter sibiricus TaxID=2268124 RepID=A0A367ZTD0_9BACT|nr:MAG: hypothetical protein OZSIB_2272 [Candidatus Ozemobacter sibiricus]
MASTTSLEELGKALAGTNPGLQKRALAIIHNQAIIEAQDLVQRFLGTQPAPDLQALALKVLKKLQEFATLPEQATPEAVLPLLQSPDPARRMYALRALRKRVSSNILYTVQQFGADVEHPDGKALVAEVLRHNPDLGNLPILLGYLQDPAAAVRLKASEALIAVFQGCLLPPLLRGLTDPAPEIVYLVRQFLKQIGRDQFMAALHFMLSGDDPAPARLAAAILDGLSGPDVLPLIRQHLAHRDPETAARLREIVLQMARRGDPEAATLVPPPPAPGDEAVLPSLPDLAAQVRETWPTAPAWLLEPLTDGGRDRAPLAEVNFRLRHVYERVRSVLTIGFVCAYFACGHRNKVADRACFRALTDPAALNTLQLLRLLSDTLPNPYGFGDLFPLGMGHAFRVGLEDPFAEPFISLQEGFALLDEYPQEAANFHAAAVAGICDLFRGLAPFMGPNRLVVRRPTPEGLKVVDLWKPVPAPIDPTPFAAVPLPANAPALFSQDSMNHLLLAPFFFVEAASGELRFAPPDEKSRWEFFDRVGAQESFLLFLTEAGGPSPGN